ncbi:hypothetical protein P0082_07945 [Candidatus Haliotispira prima]|uniref:Dihydroorotate dehydrogenase n=1 Tax=Candidatus Haliotispira prima TaxID=3034016 RepID=A0ABY8MEW8_9SPIO|nr:hypothetical protein P0082_07945 [Candidatus Haliotispira prima]
MTKSQNLQTDPRQPDLCCHYAGLSLRNPLIVAAGPLTSDPDKVAGLAQEGAGAIVLHSLFEEDSGQISPDRLYDRNMDEHTEAYDYIRETGKMMESEQYMDILADARRRTDTPIIASLDGRDPAWWQDCVFGLERAGASAIELNLDTLQLNPNRTHRQALREEQRTEKELVKALTASTSELKIPLTLKIPPHMANALPRLSRLAQTGIRGMVYFNRYCLPDIDLKHMTFQPGPETSQPIEFYTPLRYLALHCSMLQRAPRKDPENKYHCDLALSGGVHYGSQIMKALLVGASAIQVCSALMQRGSSRIATLLDELIQSMQQMDIFSLAQLRDRYHLQNDPKFLEQFRRLRHNQTRR